MSAPSKTAENGRTSGGRFAKGNAGGPGRPRGLDFRGLVAARAEKDGVTIEAALCDIFQSLLEQARQGDVQAARVLLDRLCGKHPNPMEPAPERPKMSDAERAARLEAILANAVKRREAEAKLRADKEQFLREVLDGLPAGIGGQA